MTDGLSTLLDLTNRSEFMVGGLIGLLALALVVFLTPDDKPRLEWGLVFSTAALITIAVTVGRRLGLTAGIGTLAVGGWLVTSPKGTVRRLLGWPVLATGAVLVAWRGGLPDIGWVVVLTPVIILTAGAALSAWSEKLPQVLLGPMIAITSFGIWATVPDTEVARVLLGISIPLAFATLTSIGSRITSAGAFPVVAVVTWVVAVGGEARPASIVGGWACLGLIALLGIIRPAPVRLVEERPLVTLLVQIALVVVASRVIGLWHSVPLAVAAVLVLGLAAYFGVRFLDNAIGERSPMDQRSTLDQGPR